MEKGRLTAFSDGVIAIITMFIILSIESMSQLSDK